MTHSDLLALLLPPTSLDPNNAALAAELVAEGNALDLALGYADQLLLEADPRTASATLADWERVYGLPESFITQAGITQSIAERRAALVAKDAMQGGQSRAFYISLPDLGADGMYGRSATDSECYAEPACRPIGAANDAHRAG